MTIYRIHITNSAFKIFKKLPKYIKEKLLQETEILKIDPYKGEQLKGKYHQCRSLHLSFRNTQYRIIYKVFLREKSIVIYLATTRENVYRKMEEMRIE